MASLSFSPRSEEGEGWSLELFLWDEAQGWCNELCHSQPSLQTLNNAEKANVFGICVFNSSCPK